MAEVLTESFCERCGTRYTFESAKPRVKRLTGVKVLSRGLKNFVLSDDSSLDEAMAAARSDTDREVSSQQLDAFHKTFNFCMTCRQYTCSNCWNEVEGTCLTCSPHLGHEIMPAPFPDLEPSIGLTMAIGATDVAYGNGNGVDANGYAVPEPATGAWPTHDLTPVDDGEIDVAARVAALAAIGSSDITPVDITPVDSTPMEPVAETEVAPAEVEASAAEPVEEAAPAEVEVEVAAVVDPVLPIEATAPEPTSAEIQAAELPTAPVPVELGPIERTPAATHDTLDAVAAAAAAQTADLLHRFRPGQSLDDEIDAYERSRSETPEPIVVADPEPEPIAAVVDEPEAGSVPVAAAAILADAILGAETAPEPIAVTSEPDAESEPAAATAAEAEVEPESVAAAVEPEPVITASPQPEPDQIAAAAATAAAAAAVAASRPDDVVAQPTWRIVAPEADGTPPVVPPATPVPLSPPAASATPQPEWPTRPEWPTQQRPASGLPFLGRLTEPTGGLDSLWAESSREVASAPIVPGRPAQVGGVQPCVSCGLSLSATARFCRRCGTPQAG